MVMTNVVLDFPVVVATPTLPNRANGVHIGIRIVAGVGGVQDAAVFRKGFVVLHRWNLRRTENRND